MSPDQRKSLKIYRQKNTGIEELCRRLFALDLSAFAKTLEAISRIGSLVSAKSSRWKQIVSILTFTTVVTVLNPSVPAQSVSRVVSGVVTDQHREPLRGAVVLIDDQVTKVVCSSVTDRAGKFMFRRLT
jgi:hypothetical protein